MFKVKICGITNKRDAFAAVDAGADALGFIFYDKSPRYISPPAAQSIAMKLPKSVVKIGVFVNADVSVLNTELDFLDFVQLHGDESETYCRNVFRPFVKVFRVNSTFEPSVMEKFHATAYLLDTYHPQQKGGTGLTFDWGIAAAAAEFGPVILSGGLTPDNIAEAVATARPVAIDVCSGVEATPGRKDLQKLKRLFDALQQVFF